MMSFSKVAKRKHSAPLANRSNGKSRVANRPSNFISMREARQIAEEVFSGIAWSG